MSCRPTLLLEGRLIVWRIFLLIFSLLTKPANVAECQKKMSKMCKSSRKVLHWLPISVLSPI
jgi:hypothetical protein